MEPGLPQRSILGFCQIANLLTDASIRIETGSQEAVTDCGRTHFHGTEAPLPKSESSASKLSRDSGMTLVFRYRV
jgi:hypothetical protein